MSKRAPKGAGSIEQQPSGKWKVVVSGVHPVTGKQTRLSRTFDTQREAVDFKADADDLLAKRLQEKATGQEHTDRMTLAEWLDEWLKLKKGKIENGSWAWYDQKVRLYLKPVVGVVKLANLNTLLVERFLAEMRTGGGTLKRPVTVYGQRAAITTLRAALNDAVLHRLIDSNPTKPVKKPKKDRREPRWWSAEEAAAFLAAPAVEGHRLFALFRLALDSGMRLGELFALRWMDIDFKRGEVQVRRALEEVGGVQAEKEPKTKAGRRVVAVSAATAKALEMHRQEMLEEERDIDGGVVFVTEVGRWLEKPNFQRMFRRLTTRAGLPRMRPYDLRHTAASMWLRAGASLRAVAVRLGHEDPAMTLRHYAHCLPSEQGVIADLAGKLLEKAIST